MTVSHEDLVTSSCVTWKHDDCMTKHCVPKCPNVTKGCVYKRTVAAGWWWCRDSSNTVTGELFDSMGCL